MVLFVFARRSVQIVCILACTHATMYKFILASDLDSLDIIYDDFNSMTFSSASCSSNAHSIRANLSAAVEPKENIMRTHMWHVACVGMGRERNVDVPQSESEKSSKLY